MITFLIGLAILIVGGAVYGAFCEKIVRPTNAQTPALKLRDDVDFVPISKWKATLIELLNIAGTNFIWPDSIFDNSCRLCTWRRSSRLHERYDFLA